MTTSDRAIRTCVGCRQRRPQRELFRCVIDADGHARVSRTAPGRGGWICGVDCLDAARKTRGFERAWRVRSAADVDDRLRDELNRANEQGGDRRRRCETDDDERVH
ncbi:MAG: YlxR family protein [Ilumatobacter sp.]|nr:YlxR family protein [Ilumatobacter sp.]